MKRHSKSVRWMMAAMLVVSILYTISSCLQRWPSAMVSYNQMLTETSTRALLPMCLILLFVGSCQPTALLLARRSTRSIFATNLAWLVLVVAGCTLIGTAVFGVTMPLVYGPKVLQGMPHMLLVLAVRVFMMCLSVSLVAVLVVTLGVRWPVAVAVLLAVFTLGNWVLTAFAGTVSRYLYFFWYPIGDDWPVVVVNQVVPFVGFLIVVVAADLFAFSRFDHLEG
ncbi:hypothetical protein BBOH_0535 [Bifidobacterium bohemicum DSM 22767]|uniref:Uncharacterized protein n=2 Tax=Bifidobacterium bohemicum TaxID=638617 RepID=A0A086ZGT3_9BIFI|nr:hypothetical protein BBOH_0535 [Bifidobacterium bohemicum DSM 22767]